jgi:hypothetical protein
MRFYSVIPEVDVKSTFTRRKTESGHYAESLSDGCNVPPAGRSAQQEIIELKYSAGTLSSSDNPSQMGQKGYIENRDEQHDINENLTQESHELEGCRSTVSKMDCNALETGSQET